MKNKETKSQVTEILDNLRLHQNASLEHNAEAIDKINLAIKDKIEYLLKENPEFKDIPTVQLHISNIINAMNVAAFGGGISALSGVTQPLMMQFDTIMQHHLYMQQMEAQQMEETLKNIGNKGAQA